MNERVNPISGWILDVIADVDQRHAGFAGAYLRASNERRQVIAAHLVLKPSGDLKADANIASLLNADHRTILFTTFPSIPVGLRGALRRSGSQAHEPNFYKLLHRLLDQPAHADIPRVLGRLSDLDFDKLRTVETLQQEVCTATLVEAVKSPSRAADINAGVDLLTASGVDRRALIDALRRVNNAKQLAALWTRWMRQTVFPPHPIPPTSNYMPVPDAAALRALSLRYRNCSERYVVSVLNGVDHFAEFQLEERKVVVHLRRRREVWELEGVFGKHNTRPSSAVREAVIAHLGQHGILPKEPSIRRRGDWDVLERLSQPTLFHFEHEFD